jgi:hypothetical protein
MTIDDALQSGEKLIWKTDMRFMHLDENKNELWIKGTLTFTDQGIYWNDERHLPYSRMKMISFWHYPSSQGLSHLLAKLRKGGTIEVVSDTGSKHFEFGNSKSYYKALGLLSKVFIK